MTWLFWNVRGMNKRYNQKGIRQYLQIKHIKLAGLIETRVKENNVKRVLNNIHPGWGIITNHQHAANGRLWVIWDTNWYTITLIVMGAQYIHCQIKGRTNNVDCMMTVVYGFNTIEQRKAIWDDLNGIEQGINSPWLVCGDFNAL